MGEDLKFFFKNLFFSHGVRKTTAIISAIILWFVVNHTITSTRTFANVPIRVLNINKTKTVEGMLPNSLLTRRVTLTLAGRKKVLDKIDTTDLEVHIDATGKEDSWVAEISKRNLVSLDPDVDIRSGVTSIAHNHFLIKLMPLITTKIAVTVSRPRGEPPRGYQYLDVWPQYFEHTVSGPKEEVEALKEQGIELTLNLSKIRKEDLSNLPPQDYSLHADEVSFPVPSTWTKIAIPFQQSRFEEINDPAIKTLHIDFLKKSLLPIEKPIPIRVYYPPQFSDTINPHTYPIEQTAIVKEKNALHYLDIPVHIRNVSRLFLDVVKDNMELTIKAAPRFQKKKLSWSIEYINPQELENHYLEQLKASPSDDPSLSPRQRQQLLRDRFREYMRLGQLCDEKDQPIDLNIELNANSIQLEVNNPSLKKKTGKEKNK